MSRNWMNQTQYVKKGKGTRGIDLVLFDDTILSIYFSNEFRHQNMPAYKSILLKKIKNENEIK